MRRRVNGMKKTARTLLSIGLIAAIALSGYQVYKTQLGYAAEADTKRELALLKPDKVTVPPPVTASPLPAATQLPPATETPSPTATEVPFLPALDTPLPAYTATPLPAYTETPLPTYTATPLPTPSPTPYKPQFVNTDILNLQAKNAEAVGWINIPYTAIDYPFVQAADNKSYLDKDINGKKSKAGTIFMDYWNARDFSDFNTVIYGHNMKNGSMFASLKRFEDGKFFEANRYGTIYLSHQTYTVEFFACLIVSADDNTVYRQTLEGGTLWDYLGYIKENAKCYREIGFDEADRVVTLSTCAHSFRDSRTVLIGRLLPNY